MYANFEGISLSAARKLGPRQARLMVEGRRATRATDHDEGWPRRDRWC